MSFTNVHNEFKTKLRKAGGDFIVHSSDFTLHSSYFTVHTSKFSKMVKYIERDTKNFKVQTSQFIRHSSYFTLHSSYLTLHSFLKRYLCIKDNLNCHFKVHNLWMDDLRFHIQFISISVISGRWKGEHKKLCAMKRRLG